jgi:hypothetical protein
MNPKQIAPCTAKYTRGDKTYTLLRTVDNYYGGYTPWVASLEQSYGSGTAKQLEELAELAAHLAGVCREMDARE